jgi:hypothetical protein
VLDILACILPIHGGATWHVDGVGLTTLTRHKRVDARIISELLRLREFDAFIATLLQQQWASFVARIAIKVHNRWDFVTLNSLLINVATVHQSSRIESVVEVVFDLETNIWVFNHRFVGGLLFQRHITMVLLQEVGLHVSATVFALWDFDDATTTASCELPPTRDVVGSALSASLIMDPPLLVSRTRLPDVNLED